MKTPILVVGALALAVAGVFAVRSTAGAATSTNVAVIGGLQIDKSSVPEIVAFNTTNASITLDLVVRAVDGTSIATHAAALTLGPRATGVISLQAELAHAGAKSKPYAGIVTAEVSGDASLFSDTTTIVHATQYFGSRKSPKAGFVIRPLFVAGP
jgi:hypothetical protein